MSSHQDNFQLRKKEQCQKPCNCFLESLVYLCNISIFFLSNIFDHHPHRHQECEKEMSSRPDNFQRRKKEQCQKLCNCFPESLVYLCNISVFFLSNIFDHHLHRRQECEKEMSSHPDNFQRRKKEQCQKPCNLFLHLFIKINDCIKLILENQWILKSNFVKL